MGSVGIPKVEFSALWEVQLDLFMRKESLLRMYPFYQYTKTSPMIPRVSFPPGIIKLIEYKGKEQVRVVAELPTSTKNRFKIQQMRNDMLMVDPKLDLQIRENNA